MCVCVCVCVCVFENDFVLNNTKVLICHKTLTNLSTNVEFVGIRD